MYESDLTPESIPLTAASMIIDGKVGRLSYDYVNTEDIQHTDEMAAFCDEFSEKYDVPNLYLTEARCLDASREPLSTKLFVSGQLYCIRRYREALIGELDDESIKAHLVDGDIKTMAEAISKLDFFSPPYIVLDDKYNSNSEATAGGAQFISGVEHTLSHIDYAHSLFLNRQLDILSSQSERSLNDRRFLVLGYIALSLARDEADVRQHYESLLPPNRYLYSDFRKMAEEKGYFEQLTSAHGSRLVLKETGIKLVKSIAAEIEY